MPRTDVLGRILARATHELGPIVEKAKLLSRQSFSLGEMEARVLVGRERKQIDQPARIRITARYIGFLTQR